MCRIRCFLALILAFLIRPVLATEQDTLGRVGAQIDQYSVLRSEFTQTKLMSSIKRPLVTTGRFVYSRRQGVLWQIEQPYRIAYVLSEQYIVEISADGVRRQRGIREMPGLAQVGRVFRAVLSANPAALRELFEVGLRGDPEKWEITLKPNQPQLAKLLDNLLLSGARFIRTISISEVGGDTTTILFRNTKGDNALNEAELRLFGNDSDKP